ncbi:Uncharacterized protein ChrSV_1178 [Chromobacterium vaccinii]|nr:Uncharacterized protein ChrSW_1178 [Chromobacterium vaccinii]QND88636.1 Uncharacterized protein ChrSV_1178 [Chromobacterium vaccinii]
MSKQIKAWIKAGKRFERHCHGAGLWLRFHNAASPLQSP